MPEMELNLDSNKNQKRRGRMNNIFDDVEIIVDPELEDESTVDINDYLNKYILQCRICGNLFPTDTVLDSNDECPICDSKSSNGYIYKGKLINKNRNKDVTKKEKDAIEDLNDDMEEEQIEETKSEDTDNEYNDDGNLELNIQD